MNLDSVVSTALLLSLLETVVDDSFEVKQIFSML